MTTATKGRTSAALLTALTLSLGLASADAAQATDLTYGSHLPINHSILVSGFDPFAKAVTEATGGGITFTSQPGSSVVSAKTVLTGIGDELVSSGYLADAYVADQLPTSAFLNGLGMESKGILAGSAAMTELQMLNCPGCEEDLENANAVSMAVSTISPYLMMCNGDISSTADLVGKKIRYSSSWGMFAAELGATPVSMPITDTFEALQRGVVDCVIGAEFWLESYSLWDTLTTVIDMPLGAFQGAHLVVFNQDVWEDMSADTHKIIYDNIPNMTVGIAKQMVEEASSIRAQAVERGLKYIQPDDAFVAAFARTQVTAATSVIEKAESKGIDNATDLAAQFRTLMDKWAAIADETGDDYAAFADKMRTEIFDKRAP
ncbi:TRAP-type C4-dicarboxylate transport system, substrate-binding protein [Thalassovita taeanensis]|uniref:TRAP-type C4-dicarboxylate transport system, substrate-binding protein n=2 Tax=Thalassovita taeanensis TaxID=657014 RepID=A0A1H9H7J5_9RHOB|nr:TRAP-type C4-dicarboxylate transport system, substrate-binding protein [Thalassovita taeanensis]